MAWTWAPQLSSHAKCPLAVFLHPGPIGLPKARGKQWLFWEVCVGLGRGGRNRAFDHSYLKTVNGQVQGLGRGWVTELGLGKRLAQRTSSLGQKALQRLLNTQHGVQDGLII